MLIIRLLIVDYHAATGGKKPVPPPLLRTPLPHNGIQLLEPDSVWVNPHGAKTGARWNCSNSVNLTTASHSSEQDTHCPAPSCPAPVSVRDRHAITAYAVRARAIDYYWSALIDGASCKSTLNNKGLATATPFSLLVACVYMAATHS